MAIVSKSEFARRRNVTAGRVTQWISAGQIHGDALVGEGRGAQIDEDKAIPQLRRSLDIDQRHSMNGLGTRLELGADPAPPASPHSEGAPAAPSSSVPAAPAAVLLVQPPPPPAPTTEDKIAAARLEGLERTNRRAAVEEAEHLGELVAASTVRAQVAIEIRQLIARFEGALPGIANAIAAEFKLAPRDVLHLLRGQFREIRRAGAIEARERAEPMAERVQFEVADQ